MAFQPARFAPPQMSQRASAAAGLLPVTIQCRPQDRVTCLLRARHDFVEWDVEIRDFVPCLDALPLRPGANGVDWDKSRRVNNGINADLYVAELRRQGYAVLQHGDPNLSRVVEGGLFLVEYPCERDLVATVPYWEHPAVAVRNAPMTWRVNLEEFRDFRSRCVEAGVIEAASEEGQRACLRATEQALANAEQTLVQLSRQNMRTSSQEAAIKNYQIRIGHMHLRLGGEDPHEYEGEVDLKRLSAVSLRKVRDLARADADPAVPSEPEKGN